MYMYIPPPISMSARNGASLFSQKARHSEWKLCFVEMWLQKHVCHQETKNSENSAECVLSVTPVLCVNNSTFPRKTKLFSSSNHTRPNIFNLHFKPPTRGRWQPERRAVPKTIIFVPLKNVLPTLSLCFLQTADGDKEVEYYWTILRQLLQVYLITSFCFRLCSRCISIKSVLMLLQETNYIYSQFHANRCYWSTDIQIHKNIYNISRYLKLSNFDF